MSTMAEALARVGLKPTIKESIWRVVHEQPGITRKQLTKRLSALPAGSVNSQLYECLLRGIIVQRGEGYITDLEVYENLPKMSDKPARRSSKRPEVSKQVAPAAQAAVEPLPGAVPTDAGKFVDNLTVAQARALYLALKRMFG